MSYIPAIVWRSDSNPIIARPAKVNLRTRFTGSASGRTLSIAQLPTIIPQTVFTQRITNPLGFASITNGFTSASQNIRHYMGGGTFSNLKVWWRVASKGLVSVTLYVNDAPTALVMSYDSQAFGDVIQSDTTHSVTINPGDYVYYAIVGGTHVGDGMTSVEFVSSST